MVGFAEDPTTPFGSFHYANMGRDRIATRQIDTLIGMAKVITLDGIVDQKEAEFLQDWLVANHAVLDNPVIGILMDRVSAMLQDDVLDADEAKELLATLRAFTGEAPEATGELLRSSTLPCDEPPPAVTIEGRILCFTGTCATGTRRDCQNIVRNLGGEIVNSVTRRLDFLVLGAYVTDSWAHESFGRKIEKAVEYRDIKGTGLAIVSESHWRGSLNFHGGQGGQHG